jgi:hypothetical protein
MLAAVLDMNTVDHKLYERGESLVYSAMEETGRASAENALVEERVKALADGVGPDADGRTPIVASFDARWPRRTRGMNSLDGYGHALAARTGKVVDYTFRTKVGPLKNWSASSKAMEPDMCVELVRRLNEDDTGVWVEGLCMDLDSSSRAHVREYAQTTGAREPRTLHDHNHFIKAVKGHFITLKAKLKRRGVFGKDTQLRLAQQFALMFHQHRTEFKSVSELRMALLQVLEHAFNRHASCAMYFKCPCVPGLKRQKRIRSSYNKEGEWLDKRGGPQLERVLRELVVSMIDKHGEGLLHMASTQGCEALNGLAVRMTPKGLCVAFGRAAPGRQAATVARFNDGATAAVGDVMRRVGARTGLMRESLVRIDKTRSRHSERKGSPWAKGLRKRAAASRRERTQAEDDGNGDGEYAPGMAF